MNRKPIDFRHLLERLLPLDALPSADRHRVQRALHSGVTSQIEQASLHALRQLEQIGALTRLPSTPGTETVRYQGRGLDLIALELPGQREQEGLAFRPRIALIVQAHASLDHVRRLLRLDDTMTMPAPGQGSPRASLAELLDQTGTELLGAQTVRFIPKTPAADPSAPPALRSLDADFAAVVLANPTDVVVCADTTRAPRLEPEASRNGVRSIAATAVSTENDEVFGHLEATSPEPGAFGARELALLALLADCWAIAWRRAERIEQLVFVDSLTEAYNRPYFERQVASEIARAQRDQASFALCIADIDNFKNFNTTYGYEAGNRVLVHVAHTLKTAVRPFDTVARWGGEEFAILLSAPVQSDDVVTICERLRSLVERQIVHVESLDRQMHRVSVSVSIGVARYPDDASDTSDLWRAANQALLRAKMPPKNRVVHYRTPGGRREAL
jgi:diguanylate cyclase (GGDEF)-like protein